MLYQADVEAFRLDRFESRVQGDASKAVRSLERKLLVHTREVHTENGRHSKEVRSWIDWVDVVGVSGNQMPSLDDAMATIEALVQGFGVKRPW